MTRTRSVLATIAAGSAAMVLASCGAREPAARVIVDAPANPGASMPPGSFPADGTYWGNVVADAASDLLKVELSRVFMGEACRDRAEELDLVEGEACLNDYRVEDDAKVLVSVPEEARASVARVDGPGVSYAADTALLEAVSEGGAGTDRAHAPFPVVVTVRGGTVVAVEQFWVP